MTESHRYAGTSQVPLSDLGRKQAECLQKRLKHENLAAAYSSSLKRAEETAQIAIAPRNLKVEIIHDLREKDYGHWEGVKYSDVRSQFTQEFDEWCKQPAIIAPKGGETGNQVAERAVKAFQQIIPRHPGEMILIVAHSATIRLMICSLIGIDRNRYRELEQHPTGINILDVQESGKVRLITFNEHSHCQNW